MKKKKAYVIGTKTSNSLSPTIFKHWFNKYGIDGEYGYIEIKEKNFNKEIKLILKNEDLVGLNITTPYKEKIIPHLLSHNHNVATMDKEAGKIGAVNYIAKIGSATGVWCGYNSDYLGFESSIKPFKKKANTNTVIVIGYGGASRAIIYCLYKKGKKIKLFNRSYEKINNLSIKEPPQNQFLGWEKKPTSVFFNNKAHPNSKVESYKLEELENHTPLADIIINTTPVNVLTKNKKWNIGSNTIGFDAVYRPRGGTGFLNHFKPENRID